MSFLSSLARVFTWWNGATIGTALWSRRHGASVGTDELGNEYFQSKGPVNGKVRRWVIYQGPNDASRIAPDWYGWMHGMTDLTPDQLPPVRGWEKPPLANQTGTSGAYRPAGALERGGRRAAATGDYEAWSPGEA